MSLETYRIILLKLQKLPNQQFLTLHGLGEPLLDKELPQKITLAAEMGFHGIGFATNCTELNLETSERLLQSGLDTLICSIDGVTKNTHESIRRGTNFDIIIKNVMNFITLRNKKDFSTRVLIRFIYQEKNASEWEDFAAFWDKIINKEKGDGILRFDVHNWGNNSKIAIEQKDFSLTEKFSYCEDLASRLFIASDGTLRLCCADDTNFFDLGNAIEDNPLTLWNGNTFKAYRSAMYENRLFEMKHCKTCSILSCRKKRILP